MQKQLENIFHRYYSPLCNYASKILGNSHDAEDLVQTLFIQLYSKDKLHAINNIENYLLRSVKFKCIDFIRTRQPSSDINLILDKAGTEMQDITEADIEPLFHYYAAKLPPKTFQLHIDKHRQYQEETLLIFLL